MKCWPATSDIQQTSFTMLFIVILVLFVCMAGCHKKEHQQERHTTEYTTADSSSKEEKQETNLGKTEVFPGRDEFQQSCEIVQDEAEALLEEYYHKHTSRSRAIQIVKKLKNLEQQWTSLDCRQVFGYMIPQIPTPPADTAQ